MRTSTVWEVSIRPCELDHFASLVRLPTKVRTDSAEYKFIMGGLTPGSTLLDLVDAKPERYRDLKARGTASTGNRIFPTIDKALNPPDGGLVRALPGFRAAWSASAWLASA
jgi:hypothetical protein